MRQAAKIKEPTVSKVRTAGSAVADSGGGWFTQSAQMSVLRAAGVKVEGGGPHQSKTMMLADISVLFAHGADAEPTELVLTQNLLGKPSMRARQVALVRLRELYGVGTSLPICVVFRHLWDRDEAGRPVLAILCALARDPSLRGGASAVITAAPGDQVRWPQIAATVERQFPNRYGAAMVKSLAQNAASSWTQAGFLKGAVRKERVRAVATPATAAYAALLASLCGFGGSLLLESPWMDVLDRPVEERLRLLRQAEGMGLARVRSAGDVLEIQVSHTIANLTGVSGLGLG